MPFPATSYPVEQLSQGTRVVVLSSAGVDVVARIERVTLGPDGTRLLHFVTRTKRQERFSRLYLPGDMLRAVEER